MFSASKNKNFRCTGLVLAFLILLVFPTTGKVAAMAGPADRTHPDFSGHWNLDAKKSDFGPMPVPATMSDLIEQSASGMTVKRSLANDDRTAEYEFSYTFDGSVVMNKASANHTRSRSRWERDDLVVETNLEVEGLPLRIRDRWSLDASGALVISRQFHTDHGEMHMRVVMVRK